MQKVYFRIGENYFLAFQKLSDEKFLIICMDSHCDNPHDISITVEPGGLTGRLFEEELRNTKQIHRGFIENISEEEFKKQLQKGLEKISQILLPCKS